MELIDRRKLVSDFWKGVEDGDICSIEDTDNLMENAPTVDAVEVVHGEWSTIEDDYIGMTALQCSECNGEWWFEDEPPMKIYKYCPNCCAKMDGERKVND